ncbi:MAG: DUF998 domain-containing protein [Candidatus Bathyarchaeota archaeon]|nr:DUF998 domain-containing protein [Candidatus Bathyarchaeota archaeon]
MHGYFFMRSSKTFILGVFGALAPLFYLVAVIVGGYLWSGYSHYSETVSTLTSAGAPNQNIMVPLFAIYNVFVLLLSVGLFFGIRRGKAVWGAVFLAIAAIAGLVLFWFPQDYPQGPPTTFTGTMHVVIASVTAFTSLASVLIYGLTLRKNPDWKRFGQFCLIWFPIALILGGFGAASIMTPYAGLAERLSIGSILLWIEVAALVLIKHS